MNIQKKPYEISVWEDVIVYVGKDSNNQNVESQNIADLTTIDYQYYTERQLAIIGSDTMTSPAKTNNNVLKRNINGVETLTFDMYYQYEDIDKGKIVRNPLIDLVVDERKIKLKYLIDGEDDPWHDFIVKKDDEKGREYKYSYTCTGLAANELGKTGFNVELDTELENNMGTVQQLGAAVLENSDWQLADSSEQQIIQQTNDEALYLIKLNNNITGTIRDSETQITIESGKYIYVYYTSYVNQIENYFQFIYVDKLNGLGIPDLYEDKITIRCTNTPNGTYDLYINGATWSNSKPSFEDTKALSKYRGRRYVRKQLTGYDSVLEQPILKYKGATSSAAQEAGIEANKEYYGYTTTEFLDVTSVTNYIYNSTDFKGTSYWSGYNNTSLDARVYPDVTPAPVDPDSNLYDAYLIAKFSSNIGRAVNEGIIQNYSRINKFEKGEKYRFKIWVGTLENNEVIPTTIPFRCIIKKYTLIDIDSESDKKYFEFNSEGTFAGDGYYLTDAECIQSATWRDLSSNVGIFLYPRTNSNIGIDYYIKDIQLYRYILKENGEVMNIDDVPEAQVITAYHFYDPILNAGFTSAEDYIFDDNNKDYYIPQYGSGDNEFEKVRSITAKESNRFNLLQELCETFECWVKFDVAHEVNGRISIENYIYYKPVEITASEWQENTYYIYNQITKEYVLSASYDNKKKYFISDIRKRQSKKVKFYGEILQDNYIGFKYGINLKDNNRTLDSEQIVTKIIVKDNTCEQAKNGFCTIARAQDNPLKETFALNFDYYISQGLINESTINNDLYLEQNGSIGLYPKLSRLNKERNELIDNSADLANSINRVDSEYQTEQLRYNEAIKKLSELLNPVSGTIFKYTGYQYEDFTNQYYRLRDDNGYIFAYAKEVYYIKAALTALPESNAGTITYYKITTDTVPDQNKYYFTLNNNHFEPTGDITKFSSVITYYESISSQFAAGTYFQTDENTTKIKFTGNNSSEVYVYAAARRIMELNSGDLINDNYTIQKITEVITLTKDRDEAYIKMTNAKTNLDDLQASYDSIKDQLKDIAKSTDQIEKDFNTKYSRYIQEGSWSDDNYLDDDLYYFDSLDILYQSAYPKVTYSFKVIELSQLDEYEAYKFNIGHKTFVEDVEFFGYNLVDNLKTPARETVVVTEATINLDEPDKNDLKVQNYKSHFEDLFQRITAATQSLEYHSGEYGRAAAAVTPEGAVSEEVLQKSFNTANYVIQNSRDQSVVWDDTGLYAVNLSDPAQITRLASGGILISSDGGETWGIAISGYGINASYLNAGTIDADIINIMSGSFPTFRWDALGLRAYAFQTDENGTMRSYDPTKYVAHDRFGIYGISGYLTPPVLNTVIDIEEKANFALTWDGLFIKSQHRDGYVRISPEEDIVLKQYSNISGQPDKIRAKFGLLNNGQEEVYGLGLYDEDGNPTVTTQSDGTLWLQDSIRIGDDIVQNKPRIYIGKGEESGGFWKVIRVYNEEAAEDKFVLLSDGSLIAKGVTVTGTINATSGTIGGAIISEDGIVINNGGFVINVSGQQEPAFCVENNQLVMRGIIYANDGVFSGQLNAATGSFSGQITANSGTIGGFTIDDKSIRSNNLSLTSEYTDENNQLHESIISVKNIEIGTGANISDYLSIGNLKLLNPNKNNGVVLDLSNNNSSFFKLTNDGYITGQNWSIQKENNDNYVTARFGKLVAEDGIFNGEIRSNSGYFSGDLIAGTINAATINTANFVTKEVRSLGGAFIFKPTFDIIEITDAGTIEETDQGVTTVVAGKFNVKIDISNESYFNLTDITNTDKIVTISGSDIRYGKIINKTTETVGGKQYLVIQVQVFPLDYSAIINAITVSDSNRVYNTLTLFGYGSYNNKNILMTINSDDGVAKNMMPQRSLAMESFSNLQKNTSDSGYLEYYLHLLLGDLSSLKEYNSDLNLSGYGLYADNVFLNGSLTTKNNNGLYAGINTSKNVTFDYKSWSGDNSAGTSIYDGEKIIFWGGSNSLSEGDIQHSPFIVTDAGSIFATRGEFKGSIISDSLIANAIIRTPRIYGSGNGQSEPSLKIYNTNTAVGGIGFYKMVDSIDGINNSENDDILTLKITENGFYYYSQVEPFINFGINTIEANITTLKLGTTQCSQNLIQDSVNNRPAKIQVIGGDQGQINLNYNGKEMKISDTGIENNAGVVINNGITKLRDNNVELEYVREGSYYCLYVKEAQ